MSSRTFGESPRNTRPQTVGVERRSRDQRREDVCGTEKDRCIGSRDWWTTWEGRNRWTTHDQVKNTGLSSQRKNLERSDRLRSVSTNDGVGTRTLWKVCKLLRCLNVRKQIVRQVNSQPWNSIIRNRGKVDISDTDHTLFVSHLKIKLIYLHESYR